MIEPFVAAEEGGYLVVYKPPGLHSAPLQFAYGDALSGGPLARSITLPRQGAGRNSTLLDWCAHLFPEVLTVRGRQPWEGGLLHRLDRETAGLVLLARTQDAFDSLLAQQNAGLLVKEYEALALAVPAPKLPLGFPLRVRNKKIPSVIESAFRPYGPGSKAVRPVPLSASDREASRRETAPYRTMVLESTLDREYRWFSLRLFRGFRHQIRCHLAWIGYPLLNDALYGGPQAALPGGGIALDAQGLSFTDPCTGEKRYYRL